MIAMQCPCFAARPTGVRAQQTPLHPTSLPRLLPVHCGSRSHAVRVRAAGNGNSQLGNLISGTTKAADSLTNFVVPYVPAAVPRPIAKAVVLALGALFVFSLVQKLISFATLLAVLGGGAYLLFRSQGGNDSRASAADKDNDVLANARRIMDKYK